MLCLHILSRLRGLLRNAKSTGSKTATLMSSAIGAAKPSMNLTKKGSQYYFGMKALIGADVESGLVHHVHGTAVNVADVTQVVELLHGEENAAQHLFETGQAQPDLQGQAAHRAGQAADASQGRASVSSDQAPV